MSDTQKINVDLNSLVVLIKCSDDQVRQVFISKENSSLIAHFIAQLEGQLNVSNDPLDVSIVPLTNNDSTGT